MAGYDAALSYAQQRTQFGRPLARFQIVQEKLVQMLCEITAMQLYCLRIGRLDDTEELSDTIAALGKLNNTVKARQVLAEARNLLGGNGILLENHVIRHMTDIEAIYTYRGNRDDPDPARRPGHHRLERLHLIRDVCTASAGPRWARGWVCGGDATPKRR